MLSWVRAFSIGLKKSELNIKLTIPVYFSDAKNNNEGGLIIKFKMIGVVELRIYRNEKNFLPLI